MSLRICALCAACFAAGFFSLAHASEIITTAADQQGVAITIYQDDLALIKEQRRISLPAGMSRLAVQDVSARLQPETVLLRVEDGKGSVRVVEQVFDYDLLTPGKLLERSVGREVEVVRTHPQTGADISETARVLSYQQGTVVLQMGDRIETSVPGRLVFRDIPPGLRMQPTLALLLDNPAAGVRDLELSYLTSGVSWRADYVAELSSNDDRLDLSAWVTLTNESGISYPEARLQLVAGEVQRAGAAKRGAPELMARSALAAPVSDMAQERLFDYHLYTLERPTTLADRQSKQVVLLRATEIPVRKDYVLRGAEYYYGGRYGEPGERLPVGVFLEFLNHSDSGLGLPLPKGILRTYKQDSDGRAQFVGENHLAHTPVNETVRLRLGQSFDLTATRTQTDFRRIATAERQTPVVETAYAIRVRNGGPEAVTLRVEEPVPGDWEILKESASHRKEAANLAVWELKVPAAGETLLEYRVLVRY
jgi:hypothetical protein